MPRKPQQQRAKATVDAIVEAGLTLLAQEGPKGTSTRRIAEVAGIGVGSLYEYFSDREAVHQAMFKRIVADAVTTIEPLIPTLVRMSIREAVYELLCKVRELLQKNDNRYLHCVHHGVSLVAKYPLKPLQKVLMELLMQYVMRHPELMQTRNLPTMGYIYIYGGTFTVIRHLSDPAPPISFDELARGLADMVAFSSEGSLKT
jgi:AcrR family transcriptional regulator